MGRWAQAGRRGRAAGAEVAGLLPLVAGTNDDIDGELVYTSGNTAPPNSLGSLERWRSETEGGELLYVADVAWAAIVNWTGELGPLSGWYVTREYGDGVTYQSGSVDSNRQPMNL